MKMRTQLITGMLGVSALALAACHPVPLRHAHFSGVHGFHGMTGMDSIDANGTPLTVATSLDCPMNEGELTRTAQAGDGKSCDYQGPGDETVHLALVSLDGKSVPDALTPIKTELQGLVPPPQNGPVSIEASKDEGGDRAKVDLPFFHVDAHGDKADVSIFGTKIHSDGKNAEVHTNIGLKNAVVHAGPNGAEVVAEEVGKSNASMVYVLAGDNAGPSGYRAVGYLAKGPVAGPLVVGEFRAKEGHHDADEHNDLGRLIDRNVKG
jgi:hypothetical protein